MKNKEISRTASGKQYEVRICKVCSNKLIKAKYESINRYKNRKFCSQKCTKLYLKKNKIGWFGSDILPDSSKPRKTVNQAKLSFIKVLQGMVDNPELSDTPEFKTRLKKQIKILRKEI